MAESPSHAAHQRLSSAYLVAGTLATAVYFLVPQLDVQSLLYDAIGLSAVFAVAAGARRQEVGRRAPWYLFSAGLLGFVVGDLIFNGYDLAGAAIPFPSVADAFYLAGYPLLAIGTALLIREARTGEGSAGMLDAGIITCGLLLAQWPLLGHHYVDGAGLSLQYVVAVAYPAMDVLLLAAIARLLLTPGRRTASFRYLAASAVLLLVADQVFAFAPSSYSSGSWIDAGWLLSYVLWGAAALHPSAATLWRSAEVGGPRLDVRRLALLGLGLVAGPVVLATEWGSGMHVDAAAIAGLGFLLSLLVLARFAGLARRLDRLRTDERLARSEAESSQRLLTEQNDRLRELDRLKDEFVSLVSHDLRTPLTSIVGYVELLAGEDVGPLTDEQRRFLTVVDRNSQRLLRLVSDLLFMAQLQAGRLRLQRDEVDLAEVARDCVEGAGPVAEAEKIRLSVRVGEGAVVIGERERLCQLVDNLLSNALKFTGEGGSVDVSVAVSGERVVLEIADTGIGVPAAEAERLFEQFFRASTAMSREIQGTGLGLYIANAIVEAHGGEIEIETEEGEGTTFRIAFPAVVARGRVGQPKAAGRLTRGLM